MSDLISRQAAIDALVKAIREDPYYDSNEAINGLGVCDVRVILNDLPSAQSEPQWISVSERLPEESGSYFVSGKWASGKVAVGDCEYSKDDGYFQTAWNFDVEAWMPLPEPYQEDGAERRTDD